MPDRFANGDSKNDKIPGMLDQTLNKDSMFYRHGGDLRGIINHVTYFDSLGITALWLNPVIENNQPNASYHGYAFTDHYKVDRRLGSNLIYTEMINKFHTKDIKIIQDMVYNHVGSEHWIMKDLPDSDWVHSSSKGVHTDKEKGSKSNFNQTNYRATTLLDPYASSYDKEKMLNGWFDKRMPDLNQQNPLLATYLIQNSIWWIQYANIDGYRIDTYAYCDRRFMTKLVEAILKENPDFGIFGEIWDHGTPIQTFFTKGYKDSKNVDTQLPGITDFQLYYSINAALTEPFGWTEGLNKIYYTLAEDYLYKDPFKNVIFLDNHDVSRFYSVVKEDLDLFKMGVGFLLTTRGIPMLYYGSEILMKNFADPDGKVREDFPKNKFSATGRSGNENEAFEFIQTLANYRKNNSALQNGKLKQFVPENGIYIYFRYNKTKTVMVIINTNKEEKNLLANRFSEMFGNFSKGTDVITKETVPNINMISCKPKSIQILELQ
jgi:glycosidase